jgi:hypothetical protein
VKLIKKIGFVVCVLIGVNATAQQGEFRLGFQVCPGLSWISTNKLEVSRVGSNLTASIGATGEIGISDHFAVVTGVGLQFNRGGSLRHVTGGNFFPGSRLSDDSYNSGQKPLPDGTRLKYSLQYVDVPIGLKWRSEEIGPGRIYIEAPVLSTGIAIRRRGAINAGDISASKENISKDVSPVNIAWGFGTGIECPLDQDKALTVGLHFTRGFNDVTGNNAHFAEPNPNDNPFDPNDDYILHHEDARGVINAFQIRLGILF